MEQTVQLSQLDLLIGFGGFGFIVAVALYIFHKNVRRMLECVLDDDFKHTKDILNKIDAHHISETKYLESFHERIDEIRKTQQSDGVKSHKRNDRIERDMMQIIKHLESLKADQKGPELEKALQTVYDAMSDGLQSVLEAIAELTEEQVLALIDSADRTEPEIGDWILPAGHTDVLIIRDESDIKTAREENDAIYKRSNWREIIGGLMEHMESANMIMPEYRQELEENYIPTIGNILEFPDPNQSILDARELLNWSRRPGGVSGINSLLNYAEDNFTIDSLKVYNFAKEL